MSQQSTFGLEIYASDRQFYVGRGVSITFPVEDGTMQVLPQHENMIAAIVPGEMDFTDKDGHTTTVAVSAGFIEVLNNRVKVFALTVERPEEIDIKRAEEAKERAEEQLRQKKSLQEYNANQMALARAMSRLRVTSRNSHV
nr:ATP synthase F1 subunit epsilon [uncultured Sellimonas sp.]